MVYDIIEMLWECNKCRSENKGRHKYCQTCGAAREDNCREWLPDDISSMAAVTDDNLLHKFEGGEDWHCGYCGKTTFNVDRICQDCGAERDDNVEETTKPLGGFTRPSQPARPISYPIQG